MGALKGPLPQGPMKHCGKPEQHDKHPNNTTLGGGLAAWCDGVPPLAPFVELSIRVPISAYFGSAEEAKGHKWVLELLAENGLGIIVDEMHHSGATTLRVRTGDGVDRVYPVVRGKVEGQGKLW